MRRFRIPPRRKAFILSLALLLIAAAALIITRLPLHAQDWTVWPVYEYTDPMIAQLEPTGRDLQWGLPEERGATRQFMSDHPETLGADPGLREGTLWYDEATGQDTLAYQVYICHQNWFVKPLYIGLLIENLSEAPCFASGQQVTTLCLPADDDQESWHRLTNIGLRNAYAELSGKLFKPMAKITIPAKSGEHTLVVWKLPAGSSVGARIRLQLAGQQLHCRLSTAWAWSEERLTQQLPLIARGEHHPRGSWATSEVAVNNKDDVFDVGCDEKDGRTVRSLRLCQPVYDLSGKKIGYTPDAVYTRERSFNPEQALFNNGTYGALTHADVYVKNSSDKPRTVELYLRYPDKRLKGSYVGAATIYQYDANTKRWSPGETRAVNLGTKSYVDANAQVIREWWWYTRRLAAYPVSPGETLVIPLDITHDFPAILPLGILLRKG